MPSVHGGAIVASVTPSAPLGTDAAEDRSGLRAAPGFSPGAAAERRFRFELAAHPGSVSRARQLTRSRLTGWAVCEDTVDTATLVVSELVTNAIVHSAGEHVVCELHDGDDLVRIAVLDEGCAPDEPHPSPERPEEEHGRGLLLVSALCRAWGAQDTGPGLLVWAELPRGADGTPSGDPAGSSVPSNRDLSCSGDRSHPASADTEARGDLGWSAKKPPADGRGDGTEASRGDGAEASQGNGTEASWGKQATGVSPIEPIEHITENEQIKHSRDWGGA
ncbi:ATP-binding protein [Streptomyces sp. R21]|uniref:ATP-binding protein n=1 Tax=Streptomyces sp. R21 TaxID=3238627 RepID=A0AB39PEQ8_9ACTN